MIKISKGHDGGFLFGWGYTNKDCFPKLGDHRVGILNFSHEGDIYFHMDNGTLVFDGGWEMNCGGDWNWESDEKDEFEYRHPGVLAFIEEEMNAGRWQIV